MINKEGYYYVYTHRDPFSNDIRYIGRGQGQRAWMMMNSGGDGPRYGHRSPSHFEWFKLLESHGHTLDEIVFIEEKCLTYDEAVKLEREMIRDHGYDGLFNKKAGLPLKMTEEQYEFAVALRSEGMSYENIAKELGDISTMAVWRTLTGNTLHKIGDSYD